MMIKCAGIAFTCDSWNTVEFAFNNYVVLKKIIFVNIIEDDRKKYVITMDVFRKLSGN